MILDGWCPRSGTSRAARHDLPDPAAAHELADRARDLVAELARESWGLVRPSVYETGRLVALAPWLTGHAERVAYLVGNQRPDGGWGGPDGYGLIPTLSATEALLAQLRGAERGTRARLDRADLTGAAGRGLRALVELLRVGPADLPDTPAIDLIVPYLVEAVNTHLDGLRDAPPPGLDGWPGIARLDLPPGMTATRLATVGRLVAAGAPVPEKLWHALEVLGDDARSARAVRPLGPGTIGASPAATAAWLGPGGQAAAPGGATATARAYLESVVRRYGGPVPCATPIGVFERSWVISGLARAGVPLAVPPDLVDGLAGALGPTGSATAPGLPTDADTTAVTLYALGRLGVAVEPDGLLGYDSGDHFVTWPGEDGRSVSTNAHVLDALGWHLSALGRTSRARARLAAGRRGRDGTARPDRRRPAPPRRYRDAVRRVSAWLSGCQREDGTWSDRWHASPYYATSCAVLALGRYGHGQAAGAAVSRAVEWVTASQRPDGSWGRWTGTAEETAYAMSVLLEIRTTPPAVRTALRRGRAYLRGMTGAPVDPPLWHDKDLYLPEAIVRSAMISVLYRCERRTDLIN